MTRSSLATLSLSFFLFAGCTDQGTGSKDDTATDDTAGTGGDEDGDGYTESEGDCDETNPEVNPAAEEICDGKDNNCNGEIDENGETLYYYDGDGDGFGDPSQSVMACEPDAGYVTNSDDCDDDEITVYPSADEQCDGLDNDCDGEIDEDLTTAYYRDADGDGYGDETNVIDECTSPGEGWVSSGGDCDDDEALAWTGAAELCDGIDNDCNGVVDDGLSNVWYPDADEDGYGDDAASFESCVDPGAGYLTVGGDCDDEEALAWTGASEYCDEVDNDCNGLIDDDALDATAQTADDDGDGFGSPTAVTYACAPIVDNDWDCDDSNVLEPQVVDDSASSSSADGSLTNPWTTIQDGIDNSRMCVAVLEGTYYENVDFGGNDVDVFSTAGWASTVIDGGGLGSVVTFENGETIAAELRGFTVQNGGGTLDSYVETVVDSSTVYTYTYNRYYGGGIIVDGASPALSSLWVTANNLPAYSSTSSSSTATEYTYSYGGGVFVNNSTGMSVEDVTIDWNFADEGGGFYAGDAASVELYHSDISYNEASSGGGYMVSSGTLDLTNSMVVGNWASTGGGAWIDGGSSTWWNVAAVGNDASTAAGVGIADSGSFYLYSSSVTDSVSGSGVYDDDGTAVFSAEYSNVYGNAGGDFVTVSDPTGSNGNISADGGFTSWSDNDTDDDDLSLASGSSLIDAGNPSAAYNDVDGTTNDIGAYGGPGGSW